MFIKENGGFKMNTIFQIFGLTCMVLIVIGFAQAANSAKLPECDKK